MTLIYADLRGFFYDASRRIIKDYRKGRKDRANFIILRGFCLLIELFIRENPRHPYHPRSIPFENRFTFSGHNSHHPAFISVN
ncbi:MAG: hypothetical protein KDH97_01955 [Calditrichaeota bacterium]|nr:hypothetical protein [Calditrichota bacterium]